MVAEAGAGGICRKSSDRTNRSGNETTDMNAIKPKRIILAGDSGVLGHALAGALVARKYEVVVLTRSPRERTDGVTEVEWSGEHVGECITFLDGAEAIV